MQISHKPPLEREELRDVIDLALWSGQLLLQHGAETERVEETVHRIGTGLGCEWMDILVSPNALVATTISGDEFRTKIRRVLPHSINMSTLAEINTISRQVTEGQMDRVAVRAELRRISDAPTHYPRWLVVVLVGLACAAFSRLFGGDWVIFGITFVASSLAAFTRQTLHRLHFNPLLVIVVTAFVAGCVASLTDLLNLSPSPRIALTAAVLLLVPGVPLINSAEDILKGHMVTGLVRGINGIVISLSIALGLLLALWLLGVQAL